MATLFTESEFAALADDETRLDMFPQVMEWARVAVARNAHLRDLCVQATPFGDYGGFMQLCFGDLDAAFIRLFSGDAIDSFQPAHPRYAEFAAAFGVTTTTKPSPE